MSHALSPARWICPPPAITGINTYYEYRASLSLTEGRAGAVLLLACHTDYALSLDGALLSFGQFADYAEAPCYDTILLPPLDAGEHTISITVYHVGIDTSRTRNRPSALICRLSDASGEVLLASSPDSFILRRHPAYRHGEMEMVSGQLGFTFAYNACAEGDPIPFISPDLASDQPAPLPRPIAKLSVGEPAKAALIDRGYVRFSPTAVALGARFAEAEPTPSAEDADGIRLRYDLGAETTGILSLSLYVPHDCDILVAWGEHLEDGRVRALIGSRHFTCLYRARKGENRFVHPFLRLGLRYLELLIAAPEAAVHHATVLPTLYPLHERARFLCDDPRHNHIYDVALRTLHLCMHEHYEDCPWREQALYAMDSRNQMLCGYYAFGERDFARASLELMARSLRPDHLLELCSPARVSITIPSFSAIFLTQLREHLTYGGDREFVSSLIPTVMDIADGFLARIDGESGLLPVYPAAEHWNFYEWQSGLEGHIGSTVSPDRMRFDAPLCAFVVMALRDLTVLLDTLGRGEEAERYRAAADHLTEAADGAFWVEERGCYASFLSCKEHVLDHFAELTNALMVCAGIARGAREESVCRLLAQGEGKLLPVTLSHSIFKYEALLRHGGYHRLVFDEIRRIWGGMLDRGATTFWETEQGADAFDLAGSLCHGWSAVPVYLYHKYALSPTEDTGIPAARLAPGRG